jgi:hypothetical protein
LIYSIAAKVTKEPPTVKSRNLIQSNVTELDPITNPIAEERMTKEDKSKFRQRCIVSKSSLKTILK